jgi:hypothetical protein
VAQLVASETGPRIAVVMVVVFQAVHAFILFLLKYAVLCYMTTFTTSEALDQSLFLLHIVNNVEIAQGPLSRLLFLLLLQLFLFKFVFLFKGLN